jgi:hypothetical protein
MENKEVWMTSFDRIDFKLTRNWLKKAEHIKDLNSNLKRCIVSTTSM